MLNNKIGFLDFLKILLEIMPNPRPENSGRYDFGPDQGIWDGPDVHVYVWTPENPWKTWEIVICRWIKESSRIFSD